MVQSRDYTMLNKEKWKWEMEDEGLVVVGSDLAPFSEDGLRQPPSPMGFGLSGLSVLHCPRKGSSLSCIQVRMGPALANRTPEFTEKNDPDWGIGGFLGFWGGSPGPGNTGIRR